MNKTIEKLSSNALYIKVFLVTLQSGKTLFLREPRLNFKTNRIKTLLSHRRMSKFRVIGSLIAFLILAGISCWATEKSLHMLLPAGWPEILVWGITIAFFVVASIGTKLIADSLMSNEFVENRKGKLWGGIFLVIFFWLIMSMPTNTHTFFYNDKIGQNRKYTLHIKVF